MSGRESGIKKGNHVASAHLELLRRLAINDDRAIDQVISGTYEPGLLDERTAALVRIAAVLASEPAAPSYEAAVERALASGVEEDEIFEVALALVPILGLTQVQAILPALEQSDSRTPD